MATRPTTKPALPVPQKEVVDSSKPVGATEISGEEEYYDEYASDEYDYDYYASDFRTVSEDAIQALLLSNNQDIAAIDQGLAEGGLTPTAIGQMTKEQLVKEREKLVKDILKDEQNQDENNPFLKRHKKRRRRIRPYSQVQRRPRHYY